MLPWAEPVAEVVMTAPLLAVSVRVEAKGRRGTRRQVRQRPGLDGRLLMVESISRGTVGQKLVYGELTSLFPVVLTAGTFGSWPRWIPGPFTFDSSGRVCTSERNDRGDGAGRAVQVGFLSRVPVKGAVGST